jgi:RND family efflux transporter MFP subunit
LKQTQAQTAVSGNQARYTDLMADRAGFVSAMRAEPGQVVAAGEVIVNIQDTRELEAHIPMPESRITGLQIGDPASLRLWALRETQYQARIREIAPAADSVTRTFLVKLSILNPDHVIKPGMTAGITLTRAQPGMILVPNSAVSAEGENAQVWIVDDQQKVHPRKVIVASYREDGTLLRSGLAQGDRIVVAGVQALSEGQTIRPISAGVLH